MAGDSERIRFSSALLPPYARRTKSLDVLLPILYLRGVSTGDFQEALTVLLGKDDDVIPYGDNATTGIEFAHTVAHVRSPVDAVPSVMIENGVEASFNFRRQHILRATETILLPIPQPSTGL